MRNKIFSVINVSGLATGIACSLLIYVWVQHEMSWDRFHEKRDNLYLVASDLFYGGRWNAGSGTVPALGPALKDQAIKVGVDGRIEEGVVLDAFEAPPILRFLARTLGLPFRWLGYKGDPNMPPLTRALTALGPAYIKFGQILSTRPDVVGDDLAQQLRVLQDKLPPFSVQEAKQAVETAPT